MQIKSCQPVSALSTAFPLERKNSGCGRENETQQMATLLLQCRRWHTVSSSSYFRLPLTFLVSTCFKVFGHIHLLMYPRRKDVIQGKKTKQNKKQRGETEIIPHQWDDVQASTSCTTIEYPCTGTKEPILNRIKTKLTACFSSKCCIMSLLV